MRPVKIGRGVVSLRGANASTSGIRHARARVIKARASNLQDVRYSDLLLNGRASRKYTHNLRAMARAPVCARPAAVEREVGNDPIVPLLSRKEMLQIRVGLSVTGLAAVLLGYCTGLGPAYIVGLLLIAAALAIPDKVFKLTYLVVMKVAEALVLTVRFLSEACGLVVSVSRRFWPILVFAFLTAVVCIIGFRRVEKQ